MLVSSNSEEVTMKNKEYYEYINEHRANVVKAFATFFVPLLDKEFDTDKFSREEFRSSIIELKEDILNHDISKYDDIEFEPYRKKFHPTTEEKNATEEEKAIIKEKFEEAWKHHYSVNPHHLLYWVNPDDNSIKDMSLKYIIEMICDWEAMSFKFNTNTIEWYNNKANKEKAAMTDYTREIVEDILFNIIH